jgi:hypothetical protein
MKSPSTTPTFLVSLSLIFFRRTDGWVYRPQTLPLLHEAALGFPQYDVARPLGA